MNTAYEQLEVIKNLENSRFELNVEGHIAFIDFKQEEQLIKLIHTEIPEEMAGKGIAAILVSKTLEYLESNKNTLYPYCPYVYAYIKKHPEWKRVVDPSFVKYNEL